MCVSILAIAGALLLPAAYAPPGASLAQGTLAKGTWSNLAPMLHPQNEAVVAVLGSRIYVMGGFAPGVDGPTDRVQIYDTAKNEWSEGTPLPDPVHHHGAAVVGGKIYVVGGFHQPFPKRDPIALTWVFDPATNHWDKRAPLPAPRGAMVVAAIGNLIYAAGGEHLRPPGAPVPQGAPTAYEPITDFTVYDTAADRWSTLAPMEVARDHAFVGVINDRLYVVGGRDRPKYDVTTVEEFDPRSSAPPCRQAVRAVMRRCWAASSMSSAARATRRPRPVSTARSRPSILPPTAGSGSSPCRCRATPWSPRPSAIALSCRAARPRAVEPT
jgi:hypothetical protein